MDEVVVTNGPMWGQQMGKWVHQTCTGCHTADQRDAGIDVHVGWGKYTVSKHNKGCGGVTNPHNRHKIWKEY